MHCKRICQSVNWAKISDRPSFVGGDIDWWDQYTNVVSGHLGIIKMSYKANLEHLTVYSVL